MYRDSQGESSLKREKMRRESVVIKNQRVRRKTEETIKGYIGPGARRLWVSRRPTGSLTNSNKEKEPSSNGGRGLTNGVLALALPPPG